MNNSTDPPCSQILRCDQCNSLINVDDCLNYSGMCDNCWRDFKFNIKYMHMNYKDLFIEHDYYCSESNYYSNEPACTWRNWEEFYKEYGDADVDMNLIFRWDAHHDEDLGHDYMEIFMIHQRKGIFAPHYISLISESNFNEIIQMLNVHYEKLKSIWSPMSNPHKNER